MSIRGTMTEMVRFKAPPGFMAKITAVAERDLSSASEFIRRTLLEKLRDLGEVPEERPAASREGQRS